MRRSVSVIVPFPQTRRRRFIVKTAARLASAPHKTAEKLLAATLKQQCAAMTRKGVNPEPIQREHLALEFALGAELSRRVLGVA